MFHKCSLKCLTNMQATTFNETCSEYSLFYVIRYYYNSSFSLYCVVMYCGGERGQRGTNIVPPSPFHNTWQNEHKTTWATKAKEGTYTLITKLCALLLIGQFNSKHIYCQYQKSMHMHHHKADYFRQHLKYTLYCNTGYGALIMLMNYIQHVKYSNV